jgi:hypothetical protein
MRRAAAVLAGLILLIAASVVPVAATGGRDQLDSSTYACVGNVCTLTVVSAFLDPSGGTACIDFASIVSDETGCAPAPSFTISRTLAASFGPTSIPLQLCDQTGCRASRTVIVSASDTPTGPITIQSGRVTTKVGTCTTRFKFTNRFANVVGTYTIDGTTTAETGNVATYRETSKTTCRS